MMLKFELVFKLQKIISMEK